MEHLSAMNRDIIESRMRSPLSKMRMRQDPSIHPLNSFNFNRVGDLNEDLIRDPHTTFSVRASGYSMIGAGIQPGDLLIADRSLVPTNGKIVVAMINGEPMIRRFFKERGVVFLAPENPEYPTIEVTEKMAFTLRGVVTSTIHVFG